MGATTDDGTDLDHSSPRTTAIEKAQAELRQEFDVREERRRELEFLEKGGNPLDFKLGSMGSISVQSTSFTGQPEDQCLISEAKCSSGLAASPHGDSVDSNEKIGSDLLRGSNISELFLGGENDVADGERNSFESLRKKKSPRMDKYSQIGGSHTPKGPDTSVFRFQVKSQAYARRNRFRSNRGSPFAGPKDLVRSDPAHATSSAVPSGHEFNDVNKWSSVETSEKQPETHVICNSKTGSPDGNLGPRSLNDQLSTVLNASEVQSLTAGFVRAETPQVVTDIQESDPCCPSQAAIEEHVGVLYLSRGKTDDCLSKPECGSRVVSEKHAFSSSRDSNDNVLSKDVSCLVNINQVNNSDDPSKQLAGMESVAKCSAIAEDHGPKITGESCVSEKSSGLPVANVSEVKGDKDPSTFEMKDAVHTDSMINMMDRINDHGEDDSLKEFETDKHFQHLDEKIPSSIGDEPNSTKIGSLYSQVSSSNNLSSPSENLVYATCSGRNFASDLAFQDAEKNKTKMNMRVDEEAVLERARNLEANRKRLVELAMNRCLDKRRKLHWDFVLEEMVWLANDFMQERLWKITAAMQVAHSFISGGLLKVSENNLQRIQKGIAHTVSRAVLEFWKAPENFVVRENLVCRSTLHAPQNVDETSSSVDEEPLGVQQISNSGEGLSRHKVTIHLYAMRFIKHVYSVSDHSAIAEAPATPERKFDVGISVTSEENPLSERSLFYRVPDGAMEEYKRSVESLWEEYEKIGNNRDADEVETESVSDYATQQNVYDEDEGESGGYYIPGRTEAGRSFKFAQKKRKRLQKAYAARQCDAEDLPYGQCLEGRSASRPSLIDKRYGGALHVGSFLMKRVRTSSRQKILGPYANDVSAIQMVARNDTSSGDTSSMQDDHSTLHGGFQHRRNSEIESTGELGKQVSFDGTDLSPKAKRRKAKHLSYSNSSDANVFLPSKISFHDQPLAGVQREHRDHPKRKMDSHQLDSNGNYGIYSPVAPKKPMLFKHLPDASPEVIGSVSSPVASQTASICNPSKLIKMITNRASGRKSKASKALSTTLSGSGSPWSVLEDQALVVLVHDMGPNWELISDVMNSTLYLKSSFRKPKDCLERHKALMDLRNAGEGAESADDSGISQPYPSTLPGIPKGSARQLFQRLQGPVEEDMLKAHFEKIILIGKPFHSRCHQDDNQEVKQFVHAHSSHYHALSQICPTNANAILTPLDLCEETSSSPEAHHDARPGSSIVPCQENGIESLLSSSAANLFVQGASSLVSGNALPSLSAASNHSPRDIYKNSMVRSNSLPVDEPQRQYNQMISARVGQPASISVSGPLQVANDQRVCMLSGGNAMGLICGGVNKATGVSRAAIHGMDSPGTVNMVSSGAMNSSSEGGFPTPVNVLAGSISGQAHSNLRPRDALAMAKPGQTSEEQRQMVIQELQMPVPPNGQSIPHLSSLCSTFTTQSVSPVQTFPMQQPTQHHSPMAQQPHIMPNTHHHHFQSSSPLTPQQKAYAMRLAKDRNLQQHLMHQQHQFTIPNTSISHQPHNLLSQAQNMSQASVSPTSLPHNSHNSLAASPMNAVSLQMQMKHHHGPQNVVHNLPSTGSVPNHLLKQRQRQRQQFLQQQQRLQSQNQPHSQPQGKNMKYVSRGGGLTIDQNLTIDNGHVNVPPGSQTSEKGETAVHIMQGQNMYLSGGSNQNLVQPMKQVTNRSLSQSSPQSLFSCQGEKPVFSSADGNNQGHYQPASTSVVVPSRQSVPSPMHASRSQQPLQRALSHNNCQLGPCEAQCPSNQVHINQTASTAASSQSDAQDIGQKAVVPSSSSQWKVESALYNAKSVPPAHFSNTNASPESSSASLDSIATPKQGLQRQGAQHLPITGQWQQCLHPNQQHWQSQQSQQQTQRHVVQSNLTSQPTNPGPG